MSAEALTGGKKGSKGDKADKKEQRADRKAEAAAAAAKKTKAGKMAAEAKRVTICPVKATTVVNQVSRAAENSGVFLPRMWKAAAKRVTYGASKE